MSFSDDRPSAAELRERLTLPEFPRSGAYDPRWMVDNAMGPNPLWLLEDLATRMRLQPGMRVLDLGCGTAMTSIFLAREFGVQVTALDLWVQATDNWARIERAGCAEQIVPVHADAHELPFAHGYFDAVVSVDAYHYFGTDDLYLGYLTDFIAPGGQLGIAVPGVRQEIDEIPEHLRPYWQWELLSLHTADWWRRRWELTGQVEVLDAATQQDGWRYWRHWCQVCADASDNEQVREGSRHEVAMLDADAGRTFTFALVVGQVPPHSSSGAEAAS